MIPKFRAWLNIEKKFGGQEMCEVKGWDEEGLVMLYDAGDFNWDEVDIMQSTGLKDLNGVEIYEGDVLTLKYPRDRRYKVTAKVISGSKISAMTLKFEDEFTTEEIPLYKISAEHNLEVIGNIYENKEVWEASK